MTDGTPFLTISGPTSELPFALKFFTALLSDLDFDRDYYQNALNRYGGMHLSLMNSASGLGSTLYQRRKIRLIISGTAKNFTSTL